MSLTKEQIITKADELIRLFGEILARPIDVQDPCALDEGLRETLRAKFTIELLARVKTIVGEEPTAALVVEKAIREVISIRDNCVDSICEESDCSCVAIAQLTACFCDDFIESATYEIGKLQD